MMTELPPVLRAFAGSHNTPAAFAARIAGLKPSQGWTVGRQDIYAVRLQCEASGYHVIAEWQVPEAYDDDPDSRTGSLFGPLAGSTIQRRAIFREVDDRLIETFADAFAHRNARKPWTPPACTAR